MIQAISVSVDTITTIGTKYPAILSANCCIGALLVCASSISFTICGVRNCRFKLI